MKRFCVKFVRFGLLVVSLAVMASAVFMWYRSMRVADYYGRLEPVAEGCTLHGVGSYRGVFFWGAVCDPLPINQPLPGYHHQSFQLKNGSGSSILKTRPTFLVSGLGFGLSRGELSVSMPYPLAMPPRAYRVTYVPYYSILLLGAIAPLCMIWIHLRQSGNARLRVPVKGALRSVTTSV